MRAGVKASAVVASSATYAVTLFIGKKLKIRFGPPLLACMCAYVGPPTKNWEEILFANFKNSDNYSERRVEGKAKEENFGPDELETL